MDILWGFFFQFWTTNNKSCYERFCKYLFGEQIMHSVEHVTDVLSCGVCLYSALVCVYSVLVDTPQSFPEWLY